MNPHTTPPSGPEEVRERLQWAAGVVGYGGPVGEPVFTHLPALSGAVRWVCREGDADDVRAALPVADALGAAWERLGELQTGRECLDALLAAVHREGVEDSVPVARVLRRRARLAMRARLDELAEQDLSEAYAIASMRDEALTLSVMLDRVDLATARGDWVSACDAVPELLRRTDATGDPLLQAMGLNRSAWAALGAGERRTARERYQRAAALAELHEDPVVQSRTCAGIALIACRTGDLEQARAAWQQSLALAEQEHDRAFVLHCLDGIALLQLLRGEPAQAAALMATSTVTREHLAQPREVLLEEMAATLTLRIGAQLRPGDAGTGEAGLRAPAPTYVEALAAARAAVATP